MNTRAKGMRAERRAEKELKEEGWLIARAKGSTKYNKSVDFFGLFDIIALRETDSLKILVLGNYTISKGVRRKYIQIKCNYKPSLKPYKKFNEKYCDENDSVEIWIWYDRKGWKKIVI